jgi:PhnB protein
MLSDVPPGMPVATESNTHVALHLDDEAETTKRFEALAAGGTVTMPLQDTFWGAKFGMLSDAFGIRWMFNCELKKD